APHRPGPPRGAGPGARHPALGAAPRRARFGPRRGGDGPLRPAAPRAGRRGDGGAARGARHRAGHGRVPPGPRPRLRSGTGRRHARGGPAGPGRARRLPGGGGAGARMSAASPSPAPASTTPAALELVGVRAAYGRIEVLHGVDLRVPSGCVVALLGPDGARTPTPPLGAGGRLAPTAGGVPPAGRHVNGARPHALARGGVCAFPEGRGVSPSPPVRENLRMVPDGGPPLADVEARAYEQFP